MLSAFHGVNDRIAARRLRTVEASLTPAPSIRPMRSSSSRPLLIFEISAPPAIGTTMESGAFHPSCSAISNPNGLGAFRVIRPQIHIHESPGMPVGDLSCRDD